MEQMLLLMQVKAMQMKAALQARLQQKKARKHRQKRRSLQESLLTQLLRSSKSIQIIDIFA